MATTTAIAVKTVEARSRRGPTALGHFVRVFFRDRQAVVGLVIIAIAGGAAVAAPLISPWDPLASAGVDRLAPIGTAGRDITDLPTHEIARMRIAQAPEGQRIFPRMSVAENLQMGADATDSSESDRAAGLDRVLALFPRLKERMTQRGGTLSGGEQQMLAIGRALMSRPRLLMLDEPSLGLAPLIALQIFDAIRTLNRQDGLTVLIVEQNANHALRLAHRGYVMVNGLITLAGTGTELLQRPEIRAAYLEGGRRA